MALDTTYLRLRAVAAYVKLKAAKEAVQLQAETEQTTLKADTQPEVLAAGLSFTTLGAAASYVLLRAEAITGLFLKFLRYEDQVNTTDAAALAVGKALNDVVHSAETLQRLVGKPFTDPARTRDVAQITVDKALQELVSTTETFTYVITTLYTRDFVETVLSSETLYRVFHKTLLDVVGATDDFDGSAAADDNQNIQFYKTRDDFVSAADVLFREVAYLRSAADSATTSDSAVTEFVKNLSDVVTTSEVVYARLVGQQNANDSSNTSDVYAFDLEKTLADAAAATDAAFVEFLKGLTDGATTGDTVATFMGKIAQDDVTAADSGLAVMQGYCDISYFAEDYVGIRFTF